MDDHVVRQWHLRTHLALWIVCQHDLHFNAQHALPHCHVTNRLRDVVFLWLASRDEVAILELHRFGTLRAEFSTDDNLATLGAVLHYETNDTIASAAYCKTTDEFVAERFGLCHGTRSTILDAFSEEFHTVF